MYAMQYTVQLPTNYDMQIIRDRVSTTGHLLDGFPGLKFKAYVIREKRNGATGNEYAPFYVWNDIDGMRAFCWGDPGYSAIVRDFGRHPIQDWTIVGVTDGPSHHADARSLTIRLRPLPAGVAPSQVIDSLTREFLETVGADTVWRVAAVDVTAWVVVLAEISTDVGDLGSDADLTYEVLRVATGPDAETSS